MTLAAWLPEHDPRNGAVTLNHCLHSHLRLRGPFEPDQPRRPRQHDGRTADLRQLSRACACPLPLTNATAALEVRAQGS